MHNLKKSRFIIDLPITVDNETYAALYHTLTGSFVLVEADDWAAFSSPSQEPPDADFIDDLREQGFLVPSDVDETVVFDCWKQQQVHNFDTITSKVLITRECNNRCAYCILDHPLPDTNTDMTPETARAMDEFYTNLIRERRPLSVRDDYLGGEPLLNFRVLLESAGRRFAFCRENRIDYQFTITTNGTLLTPKRVSEMKAAGLSEIRVSLAGPAVIHDRLRPSAAGEKTYDVILENLKAVSAMIPISIECQYDSGSNNFGRLPEMFEDFKKKNIAVKNVSFSPILKKRGGSRFDNGPGDPDIALNLMKQARSHGYGPEPEPPASLCRADFRSMLVFDTDGSLIPCPTLRQGEMTYGNVYSGVDFINEAMILARRLPEKCLEHCELLPVCMGGCRYQAGSDGGNFAGIHCQYETLRLFWTDYIKEIARNALTE